MRVNDEKFVMPADSVPNSQVPSVKRLVNRTKGSLSSLKRVRELLRGEPREFTLEHELGDGKKVVIRYALEEPYSMRVINIGREIYEKYGVDILSGEELNKQQGYSGDFVVAMVSLLLSFVEYLVISVGGDDVKVDAFSSLDEILAFIDEVGLNFAQIIASDISSHLQDLVSEQQNFFARSMSGISQG